MSELRSIVFLSCSRILMRRAYPFITNVDERRIILTGGVRGAPIAQGESHTAGLGIANPKVCLWEFTMVNEYTCS
jgi:hypothetical protein